MHTVINLLTKMLRLGMQILVCVWSVLCCIQSRAVSPYIFCNTVIFSWKIFTFHCLTATSSVNWEPCISQLIQFKVTVLYLIFKCRRNVPPSPSLSVNLFPQMRNISECFFEPVGRTERCCVGFKPLCSLFLGPSRAVTILLAFPQTV